MRRLSRAAGALFAGLLSMAPLTAAGPARAAPAAPTIPAPEGLTSQDVSFTGFGGITLHGTVLAPAAPDTGPRPGLVLVTGSGAGVPRTHLLDEAVAFARQGLAVLIYDKRSAGYSRFRRSYSELADDALAALRVLRTTPHVDPAAVGLWGLSEGGWVVPIAASRSADVAFSVLVGANAMTPARQQTWNEVSALRRVGVAGSLVERAKPQFSRFGGDVGLFAEAFHDGEAVLRRVRTPVLAIWGADDEQSPPAENPPLVARALRAAGNPHYTVRFFAGASHRVQVPSRDGGEPVLAPGYAETVGSWVRDVAAGRLPTADAAPPPRQPYPTVEVLPSARWESWPVLVGEFALIVGSLLAYPLVAAIRRLRGRPVRPPATVGRGARVVVTAGLVTTIGTVGYLIHLLSGRTPDPGPLLGGRPLPWLVLQALAVTASVATAGLALGLRRSATSPPPGERVRLALVFLGGAVLVPWAWHWGLFLP